MQRYSTPVNDLSTTGTLAANGPSRLSNDAELRTDQQVRLPHCPYRAP